MNKVIITYARAWSALAATRSLGKKGIEVIAGDEYACAPSSFSKYCTASFIHPSPDREPEAFLDCLEEVINEHRPDDGEFVLMPIHKEAYLIARHRKRFEGLIKFALPKIEQIEQVHDKGSLAVYAQEQNVPMPKTCVPESREQFVEEAASFAYPSFVKVRESAAAVGVKKVDTPEEALEAFDKFSDDFQLGPGSWPLIQQGVPGDDYCATFLFDNGQPRASMVYHNLRTYPVKTGTGVLRETVEAPLMVKTGNDILAKLGWNGVAEVDFRWQGGDDQPQMIEINPRFWGGLTQAVESGCDYPYLLYRLAVDGHVDPVKHTDPNVRTETPVMALLATLHESVHHPTPAQQQHASMEPASKHSSYVMKDLYV